MKMPKKLVFEEAAQHALRLINQGTSLDAACEIVGTGAVNAGALKGYLQTHYSSVLPALTHQND